MLIESTHGSINQTGAKNAKVVASGADFENQFVKDALVTLAGLGLRPRGDQVLEMSETRA